MLRKLILLTVILATISCGQDRDVLIRGNAVISTGLLKSAVGVTLKLQSGNDTLHFLSPLTIASINSPLLPSTEVGGGLGAWNKRWDALYIKGYVESYYETGGINFHITTGKGGTLSIPESFGDEWRNWFLTDTSGTVAVVGRNPISVNDKGVIIADTTTNYSGLSTRGHVANSISAIPDASVSVRGFISTGTQTFAGAKAFEGNITKIRNVATSFPASQGGANTYLQNDGAGNLSWTYGTGSGITALNALTASSQTLTTGTAGNDFSISSATSTHTFNIPSASATARGLVTTGTQTLAGVKTLTSTLILGGNYIVLNTADGSDANVLTLSGGGYGGNEGTSARGGRISIHGNEEGGSPGSILAIPGEGTNLRFAVRSGAGVEGFVVTPAEGNIVKIRNVATSFPASQGGANTYLQNDGSGNLSWSSVFHVDTATVSKTVAIGNLTYLCNTTNGAITLTLPTAASAKNLIYNFKKINTGVTHWVTIDADGSETIDGELVYEIAGQYIYVMIQSDGISWWIIGKS